MQAVPVIEAFDVLKDVSSCRITIIETFVMREFLLERAEETFHHSIVVGHSFATRAAYQPRIDEVLLVTCFSDLRKARLV